MVKILLRSEVIYLHLNNHLETVFASFVNFHTLIEGYLLWLYIFELYARKINKSLLEHNGDLNAIKGEAINFRTIAQSGIDFFSEKETPETSQYIDNLSLFWANVETYTLKDKGEMNKIMEKYIHRNGSKFSAWTQYITFEQ
jgi:hypothetical protein